MHICCTRERPLGLLGDPGQRGGEGRRQQAVPSGEGRGREGEGRAILKEELPGLLTAAGGRGVPSRAQLGTDAPLPPSPPQSARAPWNHGELSPAPEQAGELKAKPMIFRVEANPRVSSLLTRCFI